MGTLIPRAAADVPTFDPADPTLHRDPAPLYRYLRERAALRLADGTWVVTRHADVAALLRSRAISSAQVGGDPGGPAATLAENGRHLILASDPPVHTRRRGAVAHRFASHPVEALRPAVEAHVARRLDDLAAALERGGGPVDLVPLVSQRVPMDTLATLLGLPPEAAGDLRRWTTAFVDGLDPWAGGDAAARAGRALDDLVAFLAPVVAARRAAPGDDLVSTLATAPALSPDEQLHNTVLFLNAGLDTSGDLLANTVARLLETPGAWATWSPTPLAGRRPWARRWPATTARCSSRCAARSGP